MRILAAMRVVAGELGGRRLVAPEGTSTRPTTDRVREAIFNSLGSAGVLEGAIVADLFAGSGAIGIEALSRGAERCVVVERARAALRPHRGQAPTPRRPRLPGSVGPISPVAAVSELGIAD